MTEQVSIFGRERAMVDRVAKTLHAAARPLGDYTSIREFPRGSRFELCLADRRIVSVTVTFERVEQAEAADRVAVRYVPINETDDFKNRSADRTQGAADFSLVYLDERFGKPTCRDHGAMNKVSPSPPGLWRCLGGLARCPAGCQEAVPAAQRGSDAAY